ncbi:hypothetical protein BDF14DRAFT_1743472 [Spinellus fusiger]|nr:hypothetical protein BDF14DRAFT_1743472 [Spinellus fusiger]
MNTTAAHDLFQKRAPIFTGSTNSMPIDIWVTEMAHWKVDLFNHVSSYMAAIMMSEKLEGAAKESMGTRSFRAPEELYAHLREYFPMHSYRTALNVKLDNGIFFAPFVAANVSKEALDLYHILSPSDGLAHKIAKALSKAFP